ncbi:lytic transglycosylase domain-containing protein [bacterium BFN5]|nr:lytic transglycosylase domain-containing protein [bacterium BFN5]QJW46656.1 lytic transglycosylase domain-containing protein [bacterium BFN5]
MRILAWMKILVMCLVILIVGAYAGFNSDWFQKKYLYPYPYRDIIYRYALERDLDPLLVVGIIRTESKFIPQARSPKGAVGLMQLMPETAQWIASQIEYSDFKLSDLEDPEVNIRFGTWYLQSLKKEFKGNEVLMLAAYNGGRGNVKQWMQRYGWGIGFKDFEQIPFKETKEYVGRVLRSKQRYQDLYGR